MQYPALTAGAFNYDADVDIRAGAHSDYGKLTILQKKRHVGEASAKKWRIKGSLTLLFQRPLQPGLEIQTRALTWSPVPIFPPGTENDEFPPILINIGDLLSYWTNGLLKSTVHRVVFPNGAGDDRYSTSWLLIARCLQFLWVILLVSNPR